MDKIEELKGILKHQVITRGCGAHDVWKVNPIIKLEEAEKPDKIFHVGETLDVYIALEDNRLNAHERVAIPNERVFIHHADESGEWIKTNSLGKAVFQPKAAGKMWFSVPEIAHGSPMFNVVP